MKNLMALLFIFSNLSLAADAINGNTTIESFSKAKKKMVLVFGKRGKTIYCSCSYKKKKVSHQECGYSYNKYKKRSRRLEWEHIVPAHAFGQSFSEWRDGHEKCKNRKKSYKGRRCAHKVSKKFKFMEADMYNLFPSVGSINATRSNYSMAVITEKAGKKFGKCDVKILNRKIEPPNHVKGDIARVYLYMDQAYPGHGIISNKNSKLFASWNLIDPIDDAECNRVEKIASIQGNINPFVSTHCLKKK